MNEKGNDNLENNSINNKLDNNIYEPSTPVILEPPRKDIQKEENNKNKILSKININHKESKQLKEQEESKKISKELKTEKENILVEEKQEIKEEIHDEIYYKNKSNKYLITLISFFAFLLIIFMVYYYLVMTPTKVFDDIINSAFTNIREKIYELKNTDIDTTKINFNIEVNENNTNLEMLNGITIKSNIGFDLKSKNIYTQISNYRYNNLISNTNLYLQDGKTYLQFPINNKETEDKLIKLNLLNDENSDKFIIYDVRKLTSLYNILEKTKDNILDIIEPKSLERTITFKRINDTTALALKVNCILDKQDISNIYYQIFNNYINDEMVIEELETITGLNKDQIKSKLTNLMYKKILVNKISVNLYTNLANTSIISLDINIDNKYYIEIDNLNGYYYFKLIKYKNNKEIFSINGKYDIIKKDINIETTIENENTYSKVKFQYNNLNSKDSLISGTMNIELYTDLGNNPILKLYTVVASKENIELETLDLKNVYTLTEEENYTTLSESDLEKLNEWNNSIKEIYESIKNLIFNNKLNIN